ncbi:MAG: hypothetical protein FWD44_06665 [Oscillospiraceae bacterium]|nr:hypothetical protein [Oscillospiraceae bacterium]
MRIQNNIIADNSHRQLGLNTSSSGVNIERLSSGFRVNRAADDAAGLAISEKMRTQVRGLNRASLNIQDGVSLLQVGDGALQSLHTKMQRLRELAVQSANGTNQELDRNAIQLEFGELTSEINSVVSMTNFNGRLLFDGNVGASWEYNLGKITTPFTTSIPAGGDFVAPLPVPGWTPPVGFGVFPTPVPNLDTATFPSSGVFAMQIVTPADGTLNVVLDFASVYNSTPGDLSLNNILTYFRNEFNNLGVGHVVDNIRYTGTGIVFDFPMDGSTLTGIMGKPGAVFPAPATSLPRVFVGVGSSGGFEFPGYAGADQRNSLNGTPTLWSSSPFRTNPHGVIINASTVFVNDAFFGSNDTLLPPAGANAPSGGFTSVTLTVGGTPTTLNLVPGNYTSIEAFVNANKRAFETAMPRGFNLDIDSETGRLLITTVSKDGTNPPVTLTTNPGTSAALLGFGTLGAVTTEREPGGYLLIQSGANEGDGIEIEIPRLCTRSLGLSIRRPEDERDAADGGNEHINRLGADGYAVAANVAGNPMEHSLDVTSHDTASAAITVLSNAINIISIERARIGAQQNRLEYAMSNVDNTAENLQAAESRIRDADMAAEKTELVKNQILQQSSIAMLAQSNTLPQGVLQLLG